MGLLNIKAFEGKPVKSGSGISISLGESGGAQFIRVGITEPAQTAYFGGALNAEKHALKLSIDDDPTKNHLIGIETVPVSDPDAIALITGARNAVAIKIAPYCQVAKGKRPAAQMPVTHAPKTGHVVLKLPEWARPEPRKIGQGKSLMDKI